MSSFYSDLALTASDLLAEFGASLTLRRFASGAYAAGVVARTPTDYALKGALFDFGRGVVNGPGGLVQVGDKKLLLEVGTVPVIGDHVITAAGVTYAVLGVGESNPAGTPVLYTLHLRKG